MKPFNPRSTSDADNKSAAAASGALLARSIVARRRAESALRDSEIRYRQLFDSVQEGILILDGDSGDIMETNPFLLGMLGCAPEEFRGRKVRDIGSFKELAVNMASLGEQKNPQATRRGNVALYTKAGARIDVEFAGVLFVANFRRVIQCSIHEIAAPKPPADQ